MPKVGNAIKFTETGSVNIATRLATSIDDPDPILKITITDTGVGMSIQQQELLFQSFAQADTSTTRRFGGTGLGLCISRKLAGMLGGDIKVQSTHEVGSSFTLTVRTGALTGVQLVDAPGQAMIETSDFSVSKKLDSTLYLRGLRILLAEDGPDNQRLIRFILSKQGAIVESVENGQLAVNEAMAALHRNLPYDVILMDMQMPVLDGYTAVTQLRQQGYHGVIVALTAHAMEGDRNKCLASGCDDFSTKPINKPHLFATIKGTLNRSIDRQAS